ncbi:lipopolysaccharide biosynthesis protein [Arthrobacter sp. ISL-28]|nr:lipopolysaccharide biosynthesis protein [Arthrobacter sp. ISL-28]
MLQLASVVVLARLLSESDYGLVGMALAIVGVGHIIKDIGLASASVQTHSLTRGQRDNLFWINSAAGLSVAVIAATSAPFIASFYNRAELTEIVLWLAPSLLLAGMTTQYRADLTRRLKLGRVAIAELASTAIGFTAGVLTALGGWGPVALVAQQLVGGLAAVIFFCMLSGWLPALYRRQENMSHLFGMGLPLFATQIFTYVVNNADAILIGRLFGPVPVGLYNRGLQLVRVPMNQMRGPLDTLSLSVLAKLHDENDRFLQFVRRGQLVMIYPLLAAAGALIVAAPAVVDVALGPGWGEAVVYVQLIALGEAMNSLASAGGWIYMSRGLASQLLRFTIFSGVVRLVALLVGSSFGPVGVAVGFAAAHLFVWPVSLWWVGRVSQLATGAMILAALRAITVCAAGTFATWIVVLLVNGLPSTLVVLFAAAAQVIGLAILALVPAVRRDYGEIFETIRMSRGAKSP